MPDGEKKLLKCSGCNVSYNVANLKPGARFKCQKCGAINTVPMETGAAVPSAPLQAAQPPAPPPPPQGGATAMGPKPASTIQPKPSSPAVQPAKPSSAIKPPAPIPLRGKTAVGARKIATSRFGSRLGTAGKKPSRFARPGKGVVSRAQAEGGGEIAVKKSKTPLIIGIVVGAAVLGIIIFLATRSGGGGSVAKEVFNEIKDVIKAQKTEAFFNCLTKASKEKLNELSTKEKQELVLPKELKFKEVTEEGDKKIKIKCSEDGKDQTYIFIKEGDEWKLDITKRAEEMVKVKEKPPSPSDGGGPSDEITIWKPVDPALKNEIEAMLIEMQSENTDSKKLSQIKLNIINKGEDAISTMIELYLQNPTAKELEHIPDYLPEFTGKDYSVVDGQKQPSLKQVEDLKKFWMNRHNEKYLKYLCVQTKTEYQPYVFPPVGLKEKLEKESQ